MPITPDRLTRLREFGLSEYAARAYLALLDLGVAEARDVSTLSKVPQAKIYHVLEQLHDKGLAVILPEFPKKYAPVPFAEYLSRIHEEHQRAAQAIDRDREVLAEMFRVMGDTEVGNRGFFTVIRGRRNVVTKIQEMMNDAKRDVFILGTTGFASRHASLATEMDEARRRGARLRALVPLSAETIPQLGEAARAIEFRSRDLEEGSQSSRVAIVLVDGVKAFLINFLPDDDNLYAGKDIGVFTDQEAMVAALQSLVEPHWAVATPMEERTRELETGRAPVFTRVYASADEVAAAVRAALARGAGEVRGLDPQAVVAPGDMGGIVAAEVRAVGSILRALVNVPNRDVGEGLLAVLAGMGGSDIRHLVTRGTTRYWVVDEREAFFSIASGDGSDLVVHTTNQGVVRSLGGRFDALWGRGLSLADRLRELEVFPHVRPRDLGIGWLFDEMQEPVIVTDGAGRVVLWNAAATATFGHTAEQALEMDVANVLPDAAPAFLDATTGARFDVLHSLARHRDGSAFEAELTVTQATDSATSRPYALALVRNAPGRRTRVDVSTEDALARAPR